MHMAISRYIRSCHNESITLIRVPDTLTDNTAHNVNKANCQLYNKYLYTCKSNNPQKSNNRIVIKSHDKTEVISKSFCSVSIKK